MRKIYRIIFIFLFLGIGIENSFGQGCGITASCSFTANSSISGVPIGCFGDSTGALELEKYNNTIPAGIYPYCFEWRVGSEFGPILSSGTVSGVGVTPVPAGSGLIDSLPAGTYVLVTYNNASPNCKNIRTQTIDQPSSIFTAALTSTSPPSCEGTCLNAATSEGFGGTPPYHFYWSTGEIDNLVSTSTIDSLCTGIYDVTITDDAGCDTLINFVIGVSPLPIANAGNDTLVCSGSSGIIIGGSPTASSGTSPYTYLWDNAGTLNSSVVSNPAASPSSNTTYAVTVTDALNCIGTDDMTITVNPAIGIALSQTNVACFGDSTGMAMASASGGVSPYTYLWNTSPNQATDAAVNLSVGTYIVTVTDASNCTKTDSVTITEPPLLTVSITSNPISCNGVTDGTASADQSGGTSPYTYLWSGGQTTKIIGSLGPGTYCVTVTDANGCTASDCITLIDPSAINPGFDKTDITCNGLPNGTASVNPTGGVPPFTQSWNPGNFSTALSVSGLSPGNYSVTIFNSGGCDTTVSFTINQPNAIFPNTSSIPVVCFGDSNGQAISAPSGGTSPYTFLWDDFANQTTNIATGLPAGTYNVTVTDFNNCTGTDSVIVTTPSQININLTTTDATCPALCNGSATAAPSGGAGGYTFLWDTPDNSTTSFSDSLCTGTYNVTVTDAANCLVSQSFVIDGPLPMTSNAVSTDPLCNAVCTGSISLTPTGGTSPYSYSWSPSGSGANPTGLCAGTYFLTVTDFNLCVDTFSFIINEPPAISTNTNQTNESCGGLCDGSGNVEVTGGASPYTFLWNDALSTTTDTIVNLCAGTYVVTVSDASNCQKTDTVVITNIIVISVSSSIVNEDCNALGCDGSATATASGGASPYIFSWSNGDNGTGTSSLADSLCAQTYTVTATDVNGCTSVDSIIMTVSDSVLQVLDSIVGITCNGNCDGKIYALVTGGIPPYSYSWTGVVSSDTVVTGLCPGTYSVLIIDGNGCRDSVTSVVTEPDTLDASVTGINVSCNGNCDGTATANQTGGTSPYTYLWNNGQTTQTATGLCIGTFTVTITDANGCSDIDSITITQPIVLSVSTSSVLVTCNGGNDGTATATPSGGTSPYTYSWSVPQVTQTITGLSAGTYNFTVTDFNGCTINGSVTVSQPAVLNATISKTDVLCNGDCNGTATANPSGGTSPYTYLWSNLQTTQTATGLCSGNFTVTVTDFKGCTKTASVTINEPALLSVSASKTDVSCNASCNGTGTATPSGGTSPFTFLWSNGQSGATATGLCAGTFTVTASDANGCTATTTVTILQPSAISAIPNPISANCGVCDGTAKFTLSGGIPPYSHSWNTGSTAYPLTNLCAAIYTDTITDASGCQLIATVAVSNIDGPDGATVLTSNAACYNTCNGSAAIVAVSGGTTPYAYLWPDTETDTVMNNVCDGNYILQITDAIGCIHFQTFVITEPDSLQAGIITVPASCSGVSDGAAISNPSGGTGTYTYLWSNGSTLSSLFNLSSSIYTLTVTDGNNCTVVDNANITESAVLSLSFNITDVLCNGFSTGAIAVNPNGGTLPYNFVWNNGQTASTATGLGAGGYSVTVSDVNGCQITGSDTVSESASITISSAVTDATCGLSDGSITVTPSGGNSPYTFQWLTNSQTTATVTGIAAGTETVVVFDANLCSDTFDIAVNNLNGPATTSSATNASCNGLCDGFGTVTVISGFEPFSFLWNDPSSTTLATAVNLCAGNYNVEVTDGLGCITVQSVIISDPNAVSATFFKNNVSCNGGNDGSATVSASGGIVPYTYLWSNADTSQFISGLTAGTYSVTITDANGCTGTGSVTITEPSVLTASATGSAVACNGNGNGTATVTASGGTPGYTFNWSNGGTTSVIAGLSAGSYSVTVSDVNGCTATASATVTEPDVISISANVTETTCGNCSGIISISESGGTSPFTRLWSNGSVGTSISNLCPNIYSVTVTDASGCSNDTSIIMNNSDGPVPVLTGDTATCFNECDATASSTTAGGTSPYSFLWNDPANQTTSSATGLCDGTYSLFVTDAIGCIGIGTTAIAEPVLLTNSFSTIDLNCNTNCDVEVTANAAGGTSPYTFIWSNAQTGNTATGLCSGTFFITITDANNCIKIDSVVVDETSSLTLTVSGTNSNCFSSCDGLAAATVSGGATPYSYQWSNSLTSFVITNLCADTYIVTVTDNNGCTKVDSVEITEPALLDVTVSGTDVNCSNGSDGTASASPSGGTSPYAYNWSPTGQTSATATGLLPGTHTITVTDANGCTFNSSVVISQPAILTLDSIITTNTACGDTNGTASVFVSGGATPYSYLWSDGQTTQTATGLLQGTYSVMVSYNGICDTSFGGILILNPDGATVTTSSTDITCNGICDGTATAVATGGTSPYSFLWDAAANNQTTQTATGLCVGTYSVTVTDSSGCITISSATINEPAPLILTPASADLTCNGANDGTASVTVSGGNSPYSFSWSNGANTPSISNLSAGSYCVTVTDFTGCSKDTCVVVSEPDAILLSISSTNISTCFGDCSGTATVAPSGGISPYSVLWSNGQTSNNISSLCAGTYVVTVTDASSCTKIDSAIITQPSAISLDSAQITDANCGISNGEISVFVSGGTPPYTHSWSNGGSSATLTNLPAGTYSDTVKDANNCLSIFTFSLSNVNGPTVTTTPTNISCNGNCNGQIATTTTGPQPPFTHAWNTIPAQNTPTATGLCVGTYIVTVTDNDGCITIATDSVTAPNALIISITKTDISCNGANDGTAAASVSGGTSPYTFLWNNGVQTQSIASLQAGDYCVTITDNAGCSDSSCITIINPAPITTTISSTNIITCFGDCNGSASATVSGGISPYTYQWSSGQTSSTVTGLCAGMKIFTVTDANGCTKTDSVNITQPSDIIADSIVTTDASCLDSNGTATIFVSGGTTPYTYIWSNSDTSATADSLFIGTHNVTVTDASACTKIFSATISNPGAPNVTMTVTNDSCNGDCKGKIVAAASGGTPPYGFLWSTGQSDVFTATSTADSLCAGVYTVSVTGANGCVTVKTDTVTEPDVLVSSANKTDISCNGANDGTATASATGGTTPYSFMWNNGATTSTITALSAGNYCVTITDANGCADSSCIFISEPDALSLSITSNNVTCNALCNGDASATISGGTSPYSFLWSDGNTTAAISGLCAGTYSLTVTDSSGCTASSSVIITEPFSISLDSVNTFEPFCGDTNGTATVFISGGTTPYSYLWNNGDSTDALQGVSAGTYIVTVTDSSGCTANFNVNVSNTGAQTVTVSVTDISCGGNCDGNAIANVSGGVFPYIYLWSDPASTTDSAVSGLCAGVITVTVTDDNGCIVITSDTVNAGATLIASFSVTDALCNGDTGNISVSVSGGTSPYNFLWSNGELTQSIASLQAGNYCVTITDAGGCSFTGCVDVNEPSELIVTTTSTDISCSGGNDGTASASVSGGTSPYNFLWSNGELTQSIASLQAGNYCITITDTNGCTDISCIIVSEPSPITLVGDSTTPTCGVDDGTAIVTPSGGTPFSSGYTYQWNNGQITEAATGLGAGTYCVTVTDSLGCFETICIDVPVPVGPDIVIDSVSNISCQGSCDGEIYITASGMGTPFTYFWSNGDVTGDITLLCAGNYSLTVTNIFGCVSILDTVITEPSALSLTFTSVDVACNNECSGSAVINVTGGTLPYSFLWNNAQTDSSATELCAGNSNVTVTDANNCSITQSISISEPAAITVTIDNITDALCFNSSDGSVSISVNGGVPTYTYQWSNSTNTEDLANLLPGTYSVTVTDALQCDTTASVTVNATLSLVVSAIADTLICEETGGITLTGNASGNGSISYSWIDAPTGNVLGNNQSITLIPSAGINDYYLIASINGLCAVSDSFQITVSSTPDVDAGTGVTVVKGVTASIGGNPTASGGVEPHTYSWLPEAGLDNASVSNPVALPVQTTWYTVTVTTADGCSASDSVEVTVVPLIEYISGFSPNGDGINEKWEIDYVEQFPEIEVEIYNRWGQLLFKSHGYKDPWDGTFNGKPLPIGTYYYIILLNHPKFPDPITGPVTILK